MFTFHEKLTCWWPVKVQEPDPEKPGSFVERSFEAEFLILDRDEGKTIAAERKAIAQKAQDAVKADDNGAFEAAMAELEDHDAVNFRRVLLNWRNIDTPKKEPLPFNDETFALVLKHERVREGIRKAYQEAIGEDKARLGN